MACQHATIIHYIHTHTFEKYSAAAATTTTITSNQMPLIFERPKHPTAHNSLEQVKPLLYWKAPKCGYNLWLVFLTLCFFFCGYPTLCIIKRVLWIPDNEGNIQKIWSQIHYYLYRLRIYYLIVKMKSFHPFLCIS